MKRRNFLKSCLAVPFVFVSTATAKSKGKKIEMYVPSKDYLGIELKKYPCVFAYYTGKERILRGDLLVWNDDGTVSKPKKFAGVVK